MRNGMLKKIAIAVWLVTALFLGILVLNYFGNRKLIERYGEGVYQQNELGFLGFTQPYINHFNRGNVFFKLGDYTKAKQEYQSALNLKPEDPYDCKIRVNYALSYVKPIDTKKITKDNYKDTIEICETAKSILSDKDCATENNDGHYYAAQKLYNEINNFIQDLKNQYENPDPSPTPTPTPTPPSSDGDGNTPTPTPTSKPDADATDTPTPTPTEAPEGDSPTPTPNGNTPTPTPEGTIPTPTPGANGDTPTPTPGGGGETPTPTPTPGGGGEGTGTPTPTPGGGGEGTGTPTPTPGGSGEGTGTPTPTQGGGQGQGTPTPTQGDGGQGQPEPTKTPAERIRDIQNRGNQERTGSGGQGKGDVEYNYGNSASW